jgi:hypothetical protein
MAIKIPLDNPVDSSLGTTPRNAAIGNAEASVTFTRREPVQALNLKSSRNPYSFSPPSFDPQ